MRLEGNYGESNNNVWVGKILLLDLIQVAKTEEELFLKLNEKVLQLLNGISKDQAKDKDFKIELLNDSSFSIKFSEPKYITALLFKKLRENERMTQSKVAFEMGAQKCSYSQYEEGKREPSIGKFSDILDALGYEWNLILQKK